MSDSYIKTPSTVTFAELSANEYRLSSKSYRLIQIANESVEVINSMLACNPISGYEVGSLAYVNKSDFYFLRTKAIQDDGFILDLESNGALQPIKPIDFTKTNKTKRGLKYGDILFVTGGNVGSVVFVDKDYPNFVFSSHILKLNFKKNTFYTYAFLKHTISKEQANFAPEGAIKGLDTFKLNFLLDIKIPFPNYNAKNTIKFIELLTQSIINKEQLIKERHKSILQLIEQELLSNQKSNEFKFELPTIKEIEEVERLDTSLYRKDFKYWNFLVKNYSKGSKDLISRGFTWARGTSLEQGFIGTRVDSDKYHKGFYELVLPTNISQYGYVEKSTYIGTPTKLKTIEKGDIIFGGEGFGKGRTYVVVDDSHNVATNYHGIRIINTNQNLTESIFIRCFLAFWRSKGMIDFIGVGGSGGHCAPSYFRLIETPLFDDTKQKEIALLYHNPESNYQTDTFMLDNFLEQDNTFNETAGIYELDKTAKQLKEILNKAIDDIANDKEVDITLKF
ncbi:MAG: restriction endonuclease subunit S [Desulfamplus sp.]|nr:restriction endonuclease subunit S [Desulfamplus sp.]